MMMMKKKQSNKDCYKQVHSITARSVSRQFRESLKAGKSEIVDTIFKLPEAKQNIRVQDMLPSSPEHKRDNVVYSSQSPHELYPNGEYIKSNRSQDNSSSEDEMLNKNTRHW